jgi:nucleotide-binding universal stress UspA family protein
MIRTMVVPVDGSAFSEHALPVALDAARRAGAQLHLVHVHEPAARLSPDGLGVFDARTDALIREQEMEYLSSLAHRCMEKSGISPRTDLLDGPVPTAVSAYAAEVDADLVVMTTHGRGGISRAWVGSVADALVRRAAVPILLVRPRDGDVDWARDAASRHILVPLDGSDLSAAILEHALAWGRLVGARFSLLRVVLDVPFVVATGGTAVPMFMPDATHAARLAAREYLQRVASTLRAAGIDVTTEVVTHTAPVTAILDYAARAGVDGIAMATHGRGGWSRVALGSVADKVMRGTSMPVLIFRPSGRTAHHPIERDVEEPGETWAIQ